MDFFAILSALLGLSGAFLSVVTQMFVSMATKKKETKADNDIAAKISSVSNTLSKSSTELSVLQQDLQKRIDFVKDLEVKAREAENIASLSQEQVDAVNSLLNSSIKKESRSTFWRGALINFIFFIAGAIISLLITMNFS